MRTHTSNIYGLQVYSPSLVKLKKLQDQNWDKQNFKGQKKQCVKVSFVCENEHFHFNNFRSFILQSSFILLFTPYAPF